MKAFLNGFMSRLGYVPRYAGNAAAAGSLSVNLTVDSASVDAAIAKLDQLRAVADVAETALNSIAALDAFASAPAADPEREKLFCEMRALVWEIRQDRAERLADTRKRNSGADASGLPG